MVATFIAVLVMQQSPEGLKRVPNQNIKAYLTRLLTKSKVKAIQFMGCGLSTDKAAYRDIVFRDPKNIRYILKAFQASTRVATFRGEPGMPAEIFDRFTFHEILPNGKLKPTTYCVVEPEIDWAWGPSIAKLYKRFEKDIKESD